MFQTSRMICVFLSRCDCFLEFLNLSVHSWAMRARLHLIDDTNVALTCPQLPVFLFPLKSPKRVFFGTNMEVSGEEREDDPAPMTDNYYN